MAIGTAGHGGGGVPDFLRRRSTVIRSPPRSRWLLLVLLVLNSVGPSLSWREWVWNESASPFYDGSSPVKNLSWPEARSGHSMALYGSKIIVFGGQSDDTWVPHIPKTYGIQRRNGTLEVTTYEEAPVSDCSPEPSIEECRAKCTLDPGGGELCPRCCIRVGKYFNDVWQYDLNCTRWDDLACQDQGWTRLDPGAPLGGCTILNLVEECPKPNERYLHAAEVFASPVNKMYIYGGFSQFCEDYCNDMWSFDIAASATPGINAWTKITTFDYIQPHPGKRWRFATATQTTRLFLFGGHRLWHGYSPTNSEENQWSDYNEQPCPAEEWDVDSTIQYVINPRTKICKDRGGYLNDLWEYNQVTGLWRAYNPFVQILPDPGEAWDDRFNMKNVTTWPNGRAGHAMLLSGDCQFPEKLGAEVNFMLLETASARANKTCFLFVFGGYRTEHPYPTTGSFGAGAGTQRKASAGYSPYPTLPFYLNDLWRYDLKDGFWKEMQSLGSVQPTPRFDHSFLSAGSEIFILFGGYSSNYQLNDVWYFNRTTDRWLEKTSFVHAKYPTSCTDDFTCQVQDHVAYHFDARHPNYDPATMPAAENATPADLAFHYPDFVCNGTMVPSWNTLNESFVNGTAFYNATLPDGSVELTEYNVTDFEVTHYTTWKERMSVFAVPTRGKITDGRYGRPDQRIVLPIKRKQAPGWDGCRDRSDGRGLPFTQELQWERPQQRSAHRAVYQEKDGIMLALGGLGYPEPVLKQTHSSYQNDVMGDFWQYNINACPSNCSEHGICKYGYCFCHDGYYGLDCSNTSCPGDFCWYDQHTNEQHCYHCCHAPYPHYDDDVYVVDQRKVPCDHNHRGEENGICDGRGTCQCTPPYITEDCSVRDCPNNCSGNGWCSVEYPVSRCMCDDPYVGLDCGERLCLNNCTYPNGECDRDTGLCDCGPTFHPYDRRKVYASTLGRWNATFGGEDCSWCKWFGGGARVCVCGGGGGIILCLLACAGGACRASVTSVSRVSATCCACALCVCEGLRGEGILTWCAAVNVPFDSHHLPVLSAVSFRFQ